MLRVFAGIGVSLTKSDMVVFVDGGTADQTFTGAEQQQQKKKKKQTYSNTVQHGPNTVGNGRGRGALCCIRQIRSDCEEGLVEIFVFLRPGLPVLFLVCFHFPPFFLDFIIAVSLSSLLVSETI